MQPHFGFAPDALCDYKTAPTFCSCFCNSANLRVSGAPSNHIGMTGLTLLTPNTYHDLIKYLRIVEFLTNVINSFGL